MMPTVNEGQCASPFLSTGLEQSFDPLGVPHAGYGTRNPKNLPFPSMVELSAAVHGREVETFER